MGAGSAGASWQRGVISYRGRRAAVLENDSLRLTVLEEGGHLAEILDKRTGVNPLWTPPWPSIEPSTYDPQKHPEYGAGPEARLLAGIMGHNLCLDIFGPPSPEESAAGIPVHGEAGVVRYEINESQGSLLTRARLPEAQIVVERQIELRDRSVKIIERVENVSAFDHPIAWTEHVTLGPPFLERASTEFRVSATRSKVLEGPVGGADYLVAGGEFDWPLAPRSGGGHSDRRVYTGAAVSSAFTTQLMDPARRHAFFIAFSPSLQLAFGYVWKQADFPWLGIWEENHSRTMPPWNGTTLTCGMEFGVSPFPEPRRAMIDRGRLFGVPTYRWLPARSVTAVEYWVVLQPSGTVPESLAWP